MSSSCLHTKNYSDGAKLIEFNTSDKDYSVDLSKINDMSVDTNMQVHRPSAGSENEAWLAPFQDYDIDLGSGKSNSPQEMISVPKEEVKCEASRLDFMTSQSPRDRLYTAALSVTTVVQFTRMQRIRKRARWLIKKFIVFMLSHVGLTTLVGLYAVAGGFIFQRLESNMDFENSHIVHSENSHTSRAIRSVDVLNNFSAINTATFQTIREQRVEELWNLTVDLNILKPDDWKLMANKHLHMFERDIYQILMKLLMKIQDETSPGNTQEIEHPHKAVEWNYPSALLFAVTVITTIGYGDTVPKSWEAKMVCIVYALFGIPLTLLCLANLGSLLASVYRFTWKHASHLALIIVRAPERNNPLVQTSQVRVPISISLSTMIVYILGGAAIFSEWENWTFLEGSYFCFITLSTIGFGDYVPGKDTETLDSNAKRVVCALYLLFGLALLSMIFQLIQDSVTIVVGRYASFLGLSEAQIERDILESNHEDEIKDAMRDTVEVTCDSSTEHLTRDEVQISGNVGVVETYHNASNGLGEMYDDVAKHAYHFHRAMSLPAQSPKRKANRLVPKLLSVPEENVCRRKSFSGSGTEQVADVTPKEEDKGNVDDLSQNCGQVSEAFNNVDIQG